MLNSPWLTIRNKTYKVPLVINTWYTLAMSKGLEKNYDFFLKNKDKFLKEYPGKFLVIKNQEVIGVYDEEIAALSETSKEHQQGSFIIQECTPESVNDPQIFHTRVIVA